jgi:two-component system, NtrC family, response regulator AtoC
LVFPPLLEKAANVRLLREAKPLERSSNSGQPPATFLHGVSPNMGGVEVVICELAQSDVTVLLLAEGGAGKRAIARHIHENSARRQDEFRVIGCSGFAPQDLDSTIFAAGTVFLEEVADLSAPCQTSLLDLLSSQQERTNGSRRARLICGSSRDLEAEVKAERFREDLYYRISGICLRLPPLRQRKEDIPHLVSFFLAKYANEFNRPIPVLSTATQKLFNEYAWPGNIRELEDAAKAMVVLGDESVAMGGLRAMLTKPDSSGNGGHISLKQAARAASREAEKELILRVLTRTRWNRRRAAEQLQISYKALLYKLKQIGYGEFGTS